MFYPLLIQFFVFLVVIFKNKINKKQENVKNDQKEKKKLTVEDVDREIKWIKPEQRVE